MEVERVKSVPFGFKLHLGRHFVTIFNNKLGKEFFDFFVVFNCRSKITYNGRSN